MRQHGRARHRRAGISRLDCFLPCLEAAKGAPTEPNNGAHTWTLSAPCLFIGLLVFPSSFVATLREKETRPCYSHRRFIPLETYRTECPNTFTLPALVRYRNIGLCDNDEQHSRNIHRRKISECRLVNDNCIPGRLRCDTTASCGGKRPYFLSIQHPLIVPHCHSRKRQVGRFAIFWTGMHAEETRSPRQHSSALGLGRGYVG